jgi:hypothetical protein
MFLFHHHFMPQTLKLFHTSLTDYTIPKACLCVGVSLVNKLLQNPFVYPSICRSKQMVYSAFSVIVYFILY